MGFTWGTNKVQKNFFSLYAKVGGAIDMSGFATTELAIAGLFAAGFEEIGSAKAEPSINTTAQDGIENNKGSTIGASKEAAIEIILMQLTDANYAAATALNNQEVTFVYLEPDRGITYVLADLVADININTVGNSYEELPITATKEAADIDSLIVRHTIGETAISGAMTAFIISTAGDWYTSADNGTALGQTASSGSGIGAKIIPTSVDGSNGLESAVLSAGGSGHVVDDTLTIATGSNGAGTTAAVITVKGITA